MLATKPGYFGKLREPDDEFEVPEGAKASWFRAIEQKPNGKGGKKLDPPASDKPAETLV